MNNNTDTNNIALSDKGYEEISFTYKESNLSYNSNYIDSSLNFFGVSSGLSYNNLDTTFESC